MRAMFASAMTSARRSRRHAGCSVEPGAPPSATCGSKAELDAGVIARLRQVGQDVQVVEPMTEIMGHAGAIVHRPDGIIYGAADPRGDGIAAGF